MLKFCDSYSANISVVTKHNILQHHFTGFNQNVDL